MSGLFDGVLSYTMVKASVQGYIVSVCSTALQFIPTKWQQTDTQKNTPPASPHVLMRPLHHHAPPVGCE